MSFLGNLRLIFSGRFQADVSTVNNDVRHFDSQNFRPSYQEFETSEAANGWWNPPGSGAFRLINCRVRSAYHEDGSEATHDRVLGLRVGGSDDRTAGKLVDIDPQWQLASAIFGLAVSLTDGSHPALVRGSYKPAAFRDLWFGRMVGPNGPLPGDGAAAATFQSVLTDLQWADDLGGSPFLEALRRASDETGMLSIRLMTYGYRDKDPHAGDFTTGSVIGAIGPQLAGEPESYIAGRRFAPANGQTSWNGCSYFSGRVDSHSRKLFLDLSNAIQLMQPTLGTPVGTLANIGTLRAGVLLDEAVSEFTPATEENFLPIGEIVGYSVSDPTSMPWLTRTGGIVALPLSEKALAQSAGKPLALAADAALNAGSGRNGVYGQIAIRETANGLFVEAEPAVFRIDAPGRAEATLRAWRYGLPLPNASLEIRQLGAIPEQGAGPDSEPTPIPQIGVPTTALSLPATVTTDRSGATVLPISASDPRNPRGYIDGQIYLIDYRLSGQGNQARSGYDYIVVHVRDAFTTPAKPSWSDIAPILQQYANLYPIMSRSLFNLADPSIVDRHARSLHLAFSRPIDDPNHMPVTRDLSEGKRQMILRYLEGVLESGREPAVPSADVSPKPRPPAEGARPSEPPDSKTRAARQFARATGLPPAK